MNAKLQQIIKDLISEQEVLPDSSQADCLANLVMVSIPSIESVSCEELVQFLRQAAALRLDTARMRSMLPATFYAWHDAQAGQLRFSTIYGPEERLPFGAPIRVVRDPGIVVRGFLNSQYRDGIPWSELKPDDGSPVEPYYTAESPLLIWAVGIE